jgi:hypothetical protein
MSDKKFRPRISEAEYAILQEIRSKHDALASECDAQGIPIDEVKSYWWKGEHFSINVKGGHSEVSYNDMKNEIIADMKAHSPEYKAVVRDTFTKPEDAHLLVIDPADVHIGKLAREIETGDEYNIAIAVKRVIEGVYGIVDKASAFKTDKILYIVGNDILHIDTPKRQTTSGTPQDTDGMFYDSFTAARKLHVEVLETLREIADVHVQYDPSNHDYMSGMFLVDSIQSWFNKDPNVTFNCTPSHRKYFQYYNNLIGTTHGDGAKENDLPLLMAHEAKEEWAVTQHKYWYTHHIHHKRSKDIMGVTIESLRSPSGADSWHYRNGYVHSPKAIEGFLHHKKYGQTCRFNHLF